MIHKMGYDDQCPSCLAPVMYEETDREGLCEHCHDRFYKPWPSLKDRQNDTSNRTGNLTFSE